MKIRVLIVSHSSGIYGAERSLLILAKHLQKSGLYDINVTCPDMGPLVREMVRHDVKTIRLATESCLMTRFRYPRSVLKLPLFLLNVYRAYDFFRTGGYDIIHCNSNVSLEPAIAARMLNLPLVVHCRELLKGNPYNFFLGWQKLYRMVDYLASSVICVSNYAREEMLQAGCSREKTTVVYNCFERNGSYVPRESTDIADPLLGPIIGCVSNIRARKGITTLIRALAIVNKHFPEAKLQIVGGGRPSYLRRLRRLAKKLGVLHRVEFVGQVTDASAYYRRFSVFALPSYAEAFGRVYGEAGLHEIPAVGTSAGGAGEIIQDGVTGLVVAPKDPGALAQALLKLLNDPDLAKQMGRRARERVESYFTVNHQVNRISRVYDEILFQHRRRLPETVLD